MKNVDSNHTFNIVSISTALKCYNCTIVLDSNKWLKWFLIEVVDSSDIVDSDDSLLIDIFYYSTMG